jgi:ubiquinone/menaquinone biosynthesis C-methylase UbiE
MHERRFNREIERLRDPERIERLEVEKAIQISLDKLEGIQSVLDVGTGSGVFAEQFAAKGFLVTGLDANPDMVLAAQHFVPVAVFQEGIAEKMPFSEAKFDLVFMGLLLHEADDVLAVLKEAHRVAIHRLAILEWPDKEQPFGPPREHRLSSEKISTLARQAGFKTVRQVPMQHLVLYLLEK